MKKSIIVVIIAVFAGLLSNAQNLPKVKMETSLGNIIIEVNTEKAPITAFNFLRHVEDSTYANGKFYRVVHLENQPKNDKKIEVIQGGIYTEIRFDKINPIPHESTEETGLKHLGGTISMARMEPGSATTEFFICVNDQPDLDFGAERNPDKQGFAAFGQVIEGMDVVRAIQKQEEQNQTLVEKIVMNISIME